MNSYRTFYSSCDIEKSVLVFSSNVSGVQPSVAVDRLSCLLFRIQVTHEHVTTTHTNLSTHSSRQTSPNGNATLRASLTRMLNVPLYAMGIGVDSGAARARAPNNYEMG